MTGSPQGPANWRRIVEDLQVVDRFLDTLKNSGQHPADSPTRILRTMLSSTVQS